MRSDSRLPTGEDTSAFARVDGTSDAMAANIMSGMSTGFGTAHVTQGGSG